MRLEVIGYKGVVGNVTYELFKKLGYEVTGSDVGDVVNRADVYFVCVPETQVETVVTWLAERWAPLQWVPVVGVAGAVQEVGNYGRGYSAFIVVRSSVVPGTCKDLQHAHGICVCHNPEFLREAIATQDEFSPARIVIGECCKEHGDFLEVLYRPLRVPIVRTDPTTSELVKLASNNYLSCVISYWNTIEEVAKRLGVSGHQVGMIASMDPRISPYGARFHGKYGGKCLPKDAKQLIKFSESIGYDPILIKAVEEVNNLL